MGRVVAAAAVMLLCVVALPDRARAVELKILSPGATEGVLGELLPQFERSSGHKTTINYGPAGAQAARIKNGEAADIVVVSEPESERLRQEGRIVAGTETVIAKVGIGVFVRKGDQADISTADNFLRALANARVIAYADPKLGGSASILVAELLQSLDITGSIGSRTRLVPPAKPLVDLGRRRCRLRLPTDQPDLPRSAYRYVGPIPAPYQRYTNMWRAWLRPASTRRLTML